MCSGFTWRQKGAALVERSTPWMWLAAMYGLQGLGALWVTHVMALDFRQTALPVSLLFLGAVASLVLGRCGDSAGSSVWKLWIPVTVYALFITSLSHSSFPNAHTSFDTNLFHPLEYLTFAVFLSWAWYPLKLKKGRNVFVLAVMATGMVFAIADEIHQSFVPRRDPSWLDLGLDTIGLCWGVVLFLAVEYVSAYFRKAQESSD